ncbi:MAG: tetratricopeptide repeat protein [Deltaproteobacteria bacterium]|uniref:Tetratricopeptide repeat protein n=1 Tax=Candidatus Zymogenus saltonus TaxID=2844893 RepID=A0A9D8KGW6_9DELT|nr:tetratricopeptide repeat protein [Candidatus Zymogenus saltonus]
MAFDKNKSMLAAQKFFQKGQYDKAIREYERIVKEDPKDIKVRQKLGDLFAREGKRAEAISEYNYVANFYSEDGFYLRAIAVYKQVLKLDPVQIQINLKLAELYHKQNLIGDAIKQFQLVYSYYDKKGDTRKALDTLDKMAEMAPSNLALRMKLADAYYRSKFVDKSLDEYVKIGEQLKKEGRGEDLVSLYEKLIKHHPDRVDMISVLAEIYIRSNRLDLASGRIDMGLKVAPDDRKLLYMKSRILLAKQDYKASADILNKLLEVNPEFMEAKEELARVYEKLGRTDLLGKLYTELMVYFQGKRQQEKAGHYKALYNNLTSAVTGDMTSSGIEGDVRGFSGESDVIEDVIEADVIEMEDGDVLEAEVFEEVTGADEMSEPATFEVEPGVDLKDEVIDNEGRMVMLKVDTYVKYGQYREAAEVLKAYNNKNTEYISPKMRLAELYLEISQSGEEKDEYLRRAAEIFFDISSVAKRKGMYDVADDAETRAMELDSGHDMTMIDEAIPSEDIDTFDIVQDDVEEMGLAMDEEMMQPIEDMEIPESIELGDMGAEPIEISVDDGFLDEGVEFTTEEVVAEHVDIGDMDRGGGLISMTPEDDTLSEGEEYFDLRKELEGVVLDEDMSLESKGGAGLLGEDEHYSFEDVFDEFKKGVEKQFGKEDYDTHYNLGIAYREMGLFDDAIKSFNISVNDPKKRLDSFIMMGVTHRDMGDFEKSIDYFREALDTPEIKADERHGLLYELALSYEADNDIDQAYPIYKSIFNEKEDFRDVSEKVKTLAGLTSQPVEIKKEKEPSVVGKKDKISYV